MNSSVHSHEEAFGLAFGFASGLISELAEVSSKPVEISGSEREEQERRIIILNSRSSRDYIIRGRHRSHTVTAEQSTHESVYKASPLVAPILLARLKGLALFLN